MGCSITIPWPALGLVDSAFGCRPTRFVMLLYIPGDEGSMTWDETPCLTDVGVEALVVPDSRSCRYGSCTTRLGILINAFSSVLSSASSQFSDPKLLRDAYVVGSTGSSSVAYAFLFHVGWCSLGPLTFDFPERSRDCLGSVATRPYCLADMTASSVVCVRRQNERRPPCGAARAECGGLFGIYGLYPII